MWREKAATLDNTLRCLTGEEYDTVPRYNEEASKWLETGEAFWDQCHACNEDIIIVKAEMHPGYYYCCNNCHARMCADDAESGEEESSASS